MVYEYQWSAISSCNGRPKTYPLRCRTAQRRITSAIPVTCNGRTLETFFITPANSSLTQANIGFKMRGTETYQESAPSLKTCECWFRRFKSDDFDLNDKPRPGQPRKFQDVELQELLVENSAQTSKE